MEKGYKTMYENKVYTLEDFEADVKDTCDGYKSMYTGRYEINYSSILTRLIQEAGRFCKYYASDLFIDWASVERFLESWSGGDVHNVNLFGFRQSGVDGNSFILSRYNNEGKNARYNYRSLWRLDTIVKGDTIEMTLGRVF